MTINSNLDQGDVAAAPQNSPSPLPKATRTNLAQTTPTSKPKNRPAPFTKNNERQTMRMTPSNTPPRMPMDQRIHRELTSGKRSNKHSRKGR